MLRKELLKGAVSRDIETIKRERRMKVFILLLVWAVDRDLCREDYYNIMIYYQPYYMV